MTPWSDRRHGERDGSEGRLGSANGDRHRQRHAQDQGDGPAVVAVGGQRRLGHDRHREQRRRGGVHAQRVHRVHART